MLVRSCTPFGKIFVLTLFIWGCSSADEAVDSMDVSSSRSVDATVDGTLTDQSEPADSTSADTSLSDIIEVDQTSANDCPGGVGCPCQTGPDCNLGICLETPAGKRCASSCVEDCPEGYACSAVPSGGDTVYVCVSPYARLCTPCTDNGQCQGNGSEDARCVASTTVAFCGTACSDTKDCPSGYACESITDVADQTVDQCVPVDKQGASRICSCTGNAVELGLSALCQSAQGCSGSAKCEVVDEPATCLAPAAVTETCDGVDNDCDGDVDEDACDDGNPCTTDLCTKNSACDHVPADLSCDDGDVCTQTDGCDNGKCVGTDLIDCSDDNPCTKDLCDAKTGCYLDKLTDSAAAPVPCDDNNVCTTDDACDQGNCLPGAATQCDDTNSCTNDSCDQLKGCVFTNNKVPCSDGDACTTGDQCESGACVALGKLPCNDGNPCTDDSCDAKAGCSNTNNTKLCNDGNVCTQVDLCKSGTCLPGAATVCDDGNLCTTDSCDPVKGCVTSNTTTPCTDGSVCTVSDVCKDGKCVSGKALPCNDGNPCTTDSCDKAKGCVFSKNQSGCSDGNVCTVGDLCTQGTCIPGKSKSCDDSNPCTTDSCDPTKGCQNSPNSLPCDDGSVCTVGDVCAKGSCLAGKVLSCDDGNPCTDNACDNKKGCTKVNNTKPCSDGNACTLNDVCKQGTCTTTTVNKCDDGNVCTKDGCDTKTGCTKTFVSSTCSDGSVCTVGDTCAKGTCTSGKALVCDDGNPCTDDSCDPKKGCQKKPNKAVCNDDNACTVTDVCVQGVCQAGKEKSCDDSNPCTTDSCAPKSGCKNAQNKASCEDGSVCTVADYCKDGSCQAGKLQKCDDGNACTKDSCDPKKGCGKTPLPAKTPCNDENNTTSGDQCDGFGKCKGSPIVCPKPTNCVLGYKTDGKKCLPIYAKVDAICDDSKLSTKDDKCDGQGLCKGSPYSCPKPNGCIQYYSQNGVTCVPKYLTKGTKCNDGLSTTKDDQCDGQGLCKGIKINCPKATTCTPTYTFNGAACLPNHALKGTKCDDGKNTTEKDQCDGKGACQGSPYVCPKPKGCISGYKQNGVSCLPIYAQKGVLCSDNDPSTKDDKCDGSGGCKGTKLICPKPTTCTPKHLTNGVQCIAQHAAKGASCDDGSQGTKNDQCDGSGGCKGSTIVCPKPGSCVASYTPNGKDCTPKYTLTGGICDDGKTNTKNDQCNGVGGCQGTLYSCSQPPKCVQNYVQNGVGCVPKYTPKGTGCNDGQITTKNDQCSGFGQCTGTPYSCNNLPKNSCTLAHFPDGSGCNPVYAAAGTACNDNNNNTKSDVCNGSGSCKGNSYSCPSTSSCIPQYIKNGNSCTAKYASSGSSCNDNNSGTYGDKCNGSGICYGTPCNVSNTISTSLGVWRTNMALIYSSGKINWGLTLMLAPSTPISGAIQGTYQSYAKRAADQSGLEYWTGDYKNACAQEPTCNVSTYLSAPVNSKAWSKVQNAIIVSYKSQEAKWGSVQTKTHCQAKAAGY